MASLRTREASAAAEAAREAWRDHRRACLECDRAARSRTPRGMCPRGRTLNKNRALSEAGYRQEKEKDARPNPDQGELIALSDFRRP